MSDRIAQFLGPAGCQSDLRNFLGGVAQPVAVPNPEEQPVRGGKQVITHMLTSY